MAYLTLVSDNGREATYEVDQEIIDYVADIELNNEIMKHAFSSMSQSMYKNFDFLDEIHNN